MEFRICSWKSLFFVRTWIFFSSVSQQDDEFVFSSSTCKAFSESRDKSESYDDKSTSDILLDSSSPKSSSLIFRFRLFFFFGNVGI